jgi:HSP20 family molecular chaperone IbpA
MQHKVKVTILSVAVLALAGLIGWQAWSIGQMREQLAALQQQVGNPNVLTTPGTQAQPAVPPSSLFGGNGLNNVPGGIFNNQNDPFADFDKLRDEMFDHMQQLMEGGMAGSLFDDDFFGAGNFGFGGGLNTQEPEVDLSEKDDAYVITIDIPKNSNAEVSATVEGNQLNIKGKITVNNDSSNNSSTFMSTQSRQFARSMPLPADADPDGLTNVTKENRVIITIPKQA